MPPSNSESDLRRSPELQASAPPIVDTIQVKTEDGNIKTVPMYKVGALVVYENKSLGKFEAAKILSVHQDDFLEPYYSIRLLDCGREKQTDNAHLKIVLEEKEDDEDIVTEAGEPDDDTCSIATEKAEDPLLESVIEVVDDSAEGALGRCCCLVY